MENTAKLTSREIKELEMASVIAEEVINKLARTIEKARLGNPTDLHELWELKNRASEVVAVTYNVHGGVYTPMGVRS